MTINYYKLAITFPNAQFVTTLVPNKYLYAINSINSLKKDTTIRNILISKIPIPQVNDRDITRFVLDNQSGKKILYYDYLSTNALATLGLLKKHGFELSQSSFGEPVMIRYFYEILFFFQLA